MSLCLVLQRNVRPERAKKALQTLTHHDLPWLEPPVAMGKVTVLDVHAAWNEENTSSRWSVWSIHHETICSWLDAMRWASSVRQYA